MLQSVKLNTTWPGGTPRPSPAALPRISTVTRRVNKPLFQCQIKRKFKNKGATKDTVQFFLYNAASKHTFLIESALKLLPIRLN